MSSRGGRRRGRPPKSSYTVPTIINPRSNVIEKPKWLQSKEGYLGENATTGSRASSPGGSVNSFSQQYSAKKHISVTPFKKRGRKAGTRGNRGGKAYVPRPSLSVSRRRDDYRYGSDFDSDSDSDGPPSPNDDTELDVESDVDIPMSDPETDQFDDSDSDCSVSNQGSSVRKPSESAYKSAPTPLPYWLQTDREIPQLELPKSSDDLLLTVHQVLPACAVYEVLRKFSSEVRLSPFRIEDFLGALQSEELTPLLAEVHVQLLKAMLREEDVQQTWFGPLDQKDSTNSMLHFSDALTWPEVMRVFFQSDPIFAPALSLLESCEYPFTTCDTRLRVLKFLTDHFLSNTAVRQEILSEGNIKYNDHCRVCHKMGDLLCCETCPAVYHLHCLDPPLENVPNEDWQCPICTAQKCKGVTDCISDAERSGFLCRQDCLGFDRHGRKYWFIARRIFVEENCDENGEIKNDEESKKTWYYSSPFQFEQLLSALDKSEYERVLCQELYNLRPEILRQMAITVQLTNELKGNNKSYLEVEENAARAAQEAAIKVEKQEEDEQSTVDVVKTEDEKMETAEEVVEECGVEADDDFMQQLRAEAEDKPKIEPDPSAESQSSEESSSGTGGATYATRMKTGSIVPRTYTDAKRKSSVANGPSSTVKEESGRKSKSPLPPDVIFKLGMEGRYKNYVNQYSANPLALNKNQAAEERDRKRHLSHKFSLTGTAEFKWSGNTNGNRSVVLQTVRSTLLQLHSQIPAMFMHPNWSTMRKPWITAVNACVSARDLGHVLSVLVACIRPVVFNAVWHESLGHIRLQRQTALEREERKKIDKKEKKDKELEEEMHRLHTVHYTKGLKHQIWKHKGEEFRLHGQWGWRWLSATRPVRKADARHCGLRAGPWRVITCTQEEGQDPQYTQTTPEAGVEIYEIPADDPAMEVVDVTAAMLDANRRVYPKIAKKGKLDALLDWRVKLKVAEEKNLLKVDKQVKPAVKADEEAEVDIEGDGEIKAKLITTEAAQARLEQLLKHKSLHRCYNSRCDANNCYSPICRAIAPLEARIAKDKAEAEERRAEAQQKLMYSNDSTRGPVFLKRILPEDEARAKKKKVPVKYPMMSRYMTKSKKRTIFVLPDHEIRHMARRYGQALVLGYHHGSKNNSTAWIYPSARPLFKTCWFYRTTGLHSLSAAALQLRILWAGLRWEEMLSKTSAVAGGDGKNQTTTDTEIVTTDILKHRHVGRFLERTQYYQRRVVIPLDVPKTVREVTPSRSGLRKRKMVEAPRLSQPVVSEEWVDEDRLELCVIKHYHERQEKAAAAAASTPASTLTRFKTTGQTPLNGKSMEELKAQAEQQLRAQRAAHQQKGATTTPGTPNVVRLAVPGKAGGGKVSVVATPTSATGTPVTRRILITKDGKTGQIVGTPGAVQPVLLAPSPGVAAATPVANKLQITRGPDGKIQIRGLQPGQQLIRMGDGRFSIVSPSPTVMAAQAAPAQTQASLATASDGTTLPKTIIVQKTVAPGQKPPSQIIVPAGSNTAAIAQQLASGKLTIGTVNGQQVLIQAPAAAATAVVATKPGETPATPSTTTATTTTAVVTPVTVASPAAQPKQAAVILQTAQGQRIVVQNLQGGALTPQQLAAIQSQVLSRANLGANNKPMTIALRTAAPATSVQATSTVTTTTVATPTSTKTTPATTTTTTTVAATAAATSAPGSPDKGFVVTPDFIQQTIRKALRQEGLAPEIEQKLLQLQRFQEKQKTGGASEVENAASYTATTAIRKRTTSELSMTDETEISAAATPAQKPSARKVARTVEPPTAPAKSANELSPASKEAAELREQKNKERSLKAQQRAKERRQQASLARLQGVLSKHSELLKKEMLRKRALLEKELRVSVQKEISAMRLPSPTRPAPAAVEVQQASPVKKEIQPKQEEPAVSPVRNQKRRRASSPDKQVVPTPKTPKVEPTEISPAASDKKKRKRNASDGGKKKLYCICRKPYDNTKFYVGCDVCSNWFHGECVGITEAMSQKMSEFVCDGCRKENGAAPSELYCLCRQPYDESQFYICCDRCQDWFHGRCVGVLQSESDSIDEYKCPKCEPQGPFNYANSRTLNPRDYDELRKLLRQLQSHKSSWPFREPVSAKEVPDYYEIIKDPMDLRMIETKIQERRYQKLLEFIGDVTKIFDNCRYYNAKESNIARCATTLETFFVPRLKSLRASMAN